MRLPLVAGALVAASLSVTACGAAAGGSAKAPVILNTEKVERAIERSSLSQRKAHADVSCPSGVHQEKGLTFSCTALADGRSTQFSVKVLDASGHVHYEAR